MRRRRRRRRRRCSRRSRPGKERVVDRLRVEGERAEQARGDLGLGRDRARGGGTVVDSVVDAAVATFRLTPIVRRGLARRVGDGRLPRQVSGGEAARGDRRRALGSNNDDGKGQLCSSIECVWARIKFSRTASASSAS